MTMAAGWRLCRVFVTRVSSEKNLIRRFSTSSGNGNGRNAAKSTHFGFETVTEEEKDERVYSVFHNVAQKYDVMNDTMSMGVHRLWKDYFVSRISPMPRSKYIDVAGGTGDIALRLWEYVKNDLEDNSSSYVEEPQSHITVCDINQAMLDVGKAKAEGLGYTSGLTWAKGNAEELPFEDDTFDVYTIAFGLRNVTRIDKAISEAYRVLRPGGRFACLEFSEVKNPILRSLYDQYSFQVIPVLGKLIAGDWKSYQYLVESIRKFPNQEDFCEMIEEAGFSCVSYENLTFGIAAIHSGFKLEC